MISQIQCFFYKIRQTAWLPSLLLFNLVFVVFLTWYIHTTHKSYPQSIAFFFTYYNLMLPLNNAILVAAYFQFEENSNTCAKLLQMPSRLGWLATLNLSFILVISVQVIVGFLLFYYFSFPAISINEWIILIVFTLFLNSVQIPLYSYIALKFNSSMAISFALILIPFTIYFGLNTLGEGIRFFIPILYPYIILPLWINHDWGLLLKFFFAYLLFLLIVYTLVAWWYNNWDGK